MRNAAQVRDGYKDYGDYLLVNSPENCAMSKPAANMITRIAPLHPATIGMRPVGGMYTDYDPKEW